MSEVTKVRERPILFSAPMVREILDGRKTQTRWIVNPQPERQPVECMYSPTGWALEGIANEAGVKGCSCDPVQYRYGEVGDRLWVRETWAPSFKAPKCQVAYRADGRCYGVGHDGSGGYVRVFHGWLIDAAARNGADGNTLGRGMYDRWKPSIHMPRWASRINLEITEVRCEPLQDISEEDAIAEGVFVQTGDGGKPGAGYKWRGPGYWDGFSTGEFGKTFHVADADGFCCCKIGQSERLTPAKCAFRHAWEQINGAGSWERNEYVWAITFKVSTAPSDGAEGANHER